MAIFFSMHSLQAKERNREDTPSIDKELEANNTQEIGLAKKFIP